MLRHLNTAAAAFWKRVEKIWS